MATGKVGRDGVGGSGCVECRELGLEETPREEEREFSSGEAGSGGSREARAGKRPSPHRGVCEGTPGSRGDWVWRGGGAAGEGCSAPRLSAQGGNVLASPEGHAGVPVVFRGPGSRSLRARDPEGRSPHGGAGVPRSPLAARVAHIPRTGSQASFLPMPGAT